jgi:hypothetical protein
VLRLIKQYHDCFCIHSAFFTDVLIVLHFIDCTNYVVLH